MGPGKQGAKSEQEWSVEGRHSISRFLKIEFPAFSEGPSKKYPDQPKNSWSYFNAFST
jgi:hypothetical protein